jgi:hypothetical protein
MVSLAPLAVLVGVFHRVLESSPCGRLEVETSDE